MPNHEENTSASLLERVRAHQPEAWDRLVHIYGPLAYGWARKAGLQASDAADIVQEVFAVVATRLTSFRREKAGDSFRGWLWTICANKIRDHFRARHAGPTGEGGTTAQLRLQELPDAPPAEESEEGRSEISQVRHRAVLQFRDQFEPGVWAAFWNVVVEERAPGDVAADLGVSVWAVYKAKSRVLQRLRRELADLVDLPSCG